METNRQRLRSPSPSEAEFLPSVFFVTTTALSEMGFLKVSWLSIHCASLLSVLTYNSLVQAGNVVHLTVDWKEPPPSLVEEVGFRSLKARSHIQEGILNNVSMVAYGAYMANVTIGTPGQSISLVIENESSDTIVLAATAYECTQQSWANGDGPCFGGTYDPAKSSTFAVKISNGLNTQQTDGNPDGNTVGVIGDYFTDSFGIGGAELKGLQMGLALSSSNSTLYYGVLGLGPSTSESVTFPNQTYPNFIDQLVSQSLISTKAYSCYFNDFNSTTGSIVFGGIDTAKFSGTLGALTSTNGSVDMLEMAIVDVDNHGSTTFFTNSTESAAANLTAVFSISDSLTYVPQDIMEKVISYFGAVDDKNNSGLVFVDCEKLTTDVDDYFIFSFGRSGSPSINVPITEMILPLNYYLRSLAKPPFTNTCVLGMTALDTVVNPYFVLGNTFLRSAYAVFDLDHSQVALAQSVFGITDSIIVELNASETGIPALSGATIFPTSTISPSSSTPGAGGSSTPGAGTAGSIQTGAIVGIVVGVLLGLGAIGFLAFIFVRRRRATRREPASENEPPTNNNIHEVSRRDREVEKNELPAEDNKPELDLPRELESQAQHHKQELLGSETYPVEAPSATYSPVHGELDSYSAISPAQFEVTSVPELAAESMKRKPLPLQSPVSHVSETSVPDVILPGPSSLDAGRASSPDAKSASSGRSKLNILQERIERVRGEKDRLSKLQELEGMEAALQKEIMAELKKEHGLDPTGSPTGGG